MIIFLLDLKKNILFSLIIILIIGCEDRRMSDSVHYYNVPSLDSTLYSHKKVSNISITKVSVDSTIETSYIGEMWIHDDLLYFSDYLYNYIFSFQPNGALRNRYLGRGGGMNEIPGFLYLIPFDGGYCLASGNRDNFYLLDKEWNRLRSFKVKWNPKSIKRIKILPDPNKITTYEFDTGIPGIIKALDSKSISIAITASHPMFNGYFNSSQYYRFSKILAIIDTNSGKVKKLVGRRPPSFFPKNLPNFDHFSYIILDGMAWINFWSDPSIYIIDIDKDCSIGRFGKPGKDMNLDYVPTFTYKEAEERLIRDHNEFGRYHYMFLDEKNGLLFRGYFRGNDNLNDGLQIYKEFNLIADICVPKNFKMIGSIGNKYFATTNRKGDSISLIKFNLEYEN